MSNDSEPEEPQDSEGENNQEENQEKNTDVDIDQSGEIPEDMSYQEKLEAWFNALEQEFGLDFANKQRAKINAAKELGLLLDSQEWNNEFNNMILESVQKNDIQTAKLQERLLESIEKTDEQSKKFFDRALKSIDDSDKRDVELGELVKQLVVKIDARSRERHALKMQFPKEGKIGAD